MLDDAEGVATAVLHDRLLIGGLLLAFLLVACLFALAVSRSLQPRSHTCWPPPGESRAATSAPRSRWRATTSSPSSEASSNRMSSELAARVEELRRQRRRLSEAIRRTGDAVAFSLDRGALLEVMLRSTVEGAEASCGRISVPGEPPGDLVVRGRVGEIADHEPTIELAERGALNAGILAEASDGARHALAFPLRASDDTREVLGIVAVSRLALPFSLGERELFVSLAEQAALALGNVSLHERTRRQAVTDALTGLANHRRFQEVLDAEVARAHRGEEVAVLLLDVDDFKAINDVLDTSRATPSCARWRASCATAAARSTSRPATAGTSSPSCCRAPICRRRAARRARAPGDCASRDPPRERRGRAAAGQRQPRRRLGAGHDRDRQGPAAGADAALYAAKRGGKNATAAAR